jgi:RND superfamily putative drug exporter
MNPPPGPRRPRLTVAIWLLILLVATPFAAGVNDDLQASTHLSGSESSKVEAALATRFKSPFTKVALLRIAGAPAADTEAGRAILQSVTESLHAAPEVDGLASYLDREDALFLGEDGSPILIVGLHPPNGSADAQLAALAARLDALRPDLTARYPGIAFQWTGEAAVNADMRRISAHQTHVAELRVLPVTLLLLLVAFRSPVAALLPIVCGGLSIVVSLGIVAAVNRVWPASILVVSIISMVGLGLSIDYALLIVSRYRDSLREGLTRAEAVREATAHAGSTVIVSGSAVAIGFGAMLAVRVSEIRSIGLGGLIVTSVAVLVARSLLPVLLDWFGPAIAANSTGTEAAADSARLWRGWARAVTRRPLAVLIVATLPLLALAAASRHLSIDLPRGQWLPDSAESVKVLHDINAVGRGNFGQIIDVILDLPPGIRIEDEAGWRAASKLARSLARDPRLRHVWAVTSLNPMPLAGPETLRRLPDPVRHRFVSEDGRSIVIELLPRKDLVTPDAVALVRELRAADPAVLTGIAGAHLEIGGVPAFNADYEDAIRHTIGYVVAGVVIATLLVLSLVFRSVLIPLKAVALNLLSVAAAFGAMTLVFQDGIGISLVGLSRRIEGGFPIVPVLVFCIVFGLSMDYEVFIVARVTDCRRQGRSDADALIEGLAGTGRVISFAAAIMVMVFFSFMFGDFLLIKILGFALSVAVLLDATVIRLALGPALIRLAGRWNWWPGA